MRVLFDVRFKMKNFVVRLILAVLVIPVLAIAILNGLTYRGADSAIASVRLSKDKHDLPAGVRIHVRSSAGSPIAGVRFSYECHSGITPHVVSDSNGFAFIEQTEDNRVLGLYIVDPEQLRHRYTEIWNPVYDSNLFARFLGILFDPQVNIEFTVTLHSSVDHIRTEQPDAGKPNPAAR